MDWKKFFMPDLKKILLVAVLLVITALFWPRPYLADVNTYGGPFAFAQVGTMPCPPDLPACSHTPHIFYSALIIDIIIWYLIACGLVFAYNKCNKGK